MQVVCIRKTLRAAGVPLVASFQRPPIDTSISSTPVIALNQHFKFVAANTSRRALFNATFNSPSRRLVAFAPVAASFYHLGSADGNSALTNKTTPQPVQGCFPLKREQTRSASSSPSPSVNYPRETPTSVPDVPPTTSQSSASRQESSTESRSEGSPLASKTSLSPQCRS